MRWELKVASPPLEGGFFVAARNLRPRCRGRRKGKVDGPLDQYGFTLLLDCRRQRARRHCSLLVLGRRRASFRRNLSLGHLCRERLGFIHHRFFATLTASDGRVFASSTMRQFVMLGLLGGFTTFSSFSLQTLNLAQDGEWLKAGGIIVGSVVLCLVAVWLGHLLALPINSMKWI